jgi:hypothetical protein
MYDECEFEMIKEQHRQELVGMVWQYALALEDYVVKLRRQVNTHASRQNLRLPYPDLESDFKVRFFRDYPAFEEFREVLSVDETDWVLPD